MINYVQKWAPPLLITSTMSNPRLPAELLDHVVDLLHDAEHTLRNCCLVSKAWIPRTRKHLFATITFDTEKDLQPWKEAFADPSTSPARFTKTLVVGCSHIVTDTYAEPGGWITGFSSVVHLEVVSRAFSANSTVSFIPFHGFSPVIKSLRVDIALLPPLQMLNFILSSPLLEDLTVVSPYRVLTDESGDSDVGLSSVVRASGLPRFTGSLSLRMKGGMHSVARGLLSLPGGIHFRNLTLTWCHKKDPLSVTALVECCSHTLESLAISRDVFCTSIRHLYLHQ